MLPRKPGQHGAQISSFIQYVNEDLGPIPLFIKRGAQGYLYYGNYVEPRFSDRLSYNEMARELPKHVRQHWANVLGDMPAKGKKMWVIQALKESWSKATIGWCTDSGHFTPWDPNLYSEKGEGNV